MGGRASWWCGLLVFSVAGCPGPMSDDAGPDVPTSDSPRVPDVPEVELDAPFDARDDAGRDDPDVGRDAGAMDAGSDVMDAGVVDAGHDAMSVTDAGHDAPPDAGAGGCASSTPFGAPTLVAGLDTASSERTGTLTADELTAYTHFYEGGVNRIVRLRRPDRAAPFADPTVVTVTSLAGFGDPALSPDDLTLYFVARDPATRSGFDLFAVRRADVSSEFAPPATRLIAPSSVDHENGPSASVGALFFYRSFPGESIYVAPFTAGEPGASMLVSELGLAGSASNPVVSADGLTLFLASNASPSVGQDIWVASRASTAAPFGPARHLPEVSGATNEHPIAISRDGCRLYLARSGPVGPYDWWVAQR